MPPNLPMRDSDIMSQGWVPALEFFKDSQGFHGAVRTENHWIITFPTMANPIFQKAIAINSPIHVISFPLREKIIQILLTANINNG